MNNRLSLLASILFRILPINKNTVLFSSFSDMYNDNPRYISEKLHELDPTVNIVWVVSQRTEMAEVPDYVKKVEKDSLKHSYYRICSKVAIDNYVGNVFCLGDPRGFWKFRPLIRRSQVNYSTWHGTPLKRIGLDVPGHEKFDLITTTDGYLLNSTYEKDIFEKAYGKAPVFLLGAARNDPLFNKDEIYIKNIRQKLGLPLDKRIVLYAPTFRNGLGNNETTTVIMQIEDVRRCVNALKEKFGGEWIFVYRVHQKYSQGFSNYFESGEVVDGNVHSDMAEYLVASDVLITDYSGSLFDYTITQKPCFLYTPDEEEYNSSRGLYLSLDELPYSHSQNIDELISNIQKYDENISKDKAEKFNNRIGLIDDGKASERIAKLIIKHIKNR